MWPFIKVKFIDQSQHYGNEELEISFPIIKYVDFITFKEKEDSLKLFEKAYKPKKPVWEQSEEDSEPESQKKTQSQQDSGSDYTTSEEEGEEDKDSENPLDEEEEDEEEKSEQSNEILEDKPTKEPKQAKNKNFVNKLLSVCLINVIIKILEKEKS